MERLVIECDVCGKDVTHSCYLNVRSIGFSDAPSLQDRVALCSEECYQQFYGLLPARIAAQEEERGKWVMEQSEKEFSKLQAIGRMPYAAFSPPIRG